MKTTMKINLMLVALVIISTAAFVRQASNETSNKETKSKTMNTYVIVRDIPAVGDLKAEDLKGISQKSCSVIKDLGPGIEWVQSYVTDNRIFCIYRAENEAILKTHAEKGGFPINSVHKLSAMISPATATARLEEIKK